MRPWPTARTSSSAADKRDRKAVKGSAPGGGWRHGVSPEPTQRRAVLGVNGFDRNALPLTEIVFGQARIQSQRQAAGVRKLAGKAGATLQCR